MTMPDSPGGEAPRIIRCPHCGGTMFSVFYEVPTLVTINTVTGAVAEVLLTPGNGAPYSGGRPAADCDNCEAEFTGTLAEAICSISNEKPWPPRASVG
jgi:hypothetical protein